MGGRYITTDNAYVGAQKVLITPDVSGKVINVAVREGQHVKPGDELFELDPEPYRLALKQAAGQARRRAHRLRQAQDQPRLADAADRSRAEERRTQADATSSARASWWQSQAGSQADVDTATSDW